MEIERKGITDVLSGYDMYKTPYFSLWRDKTLKFSQVEVDDVETAKEILRENLEQAARSGTTTTYTLKFYQSLDKKGAITNSTPIVGSFNFRLNEPEMGMYAANGNSNPYFQMLIKENEQLKDKLNDMEQRFEQWESENEPVYTHDKLGIMGTIGAAGEQYPWLQEHIKDLVTFVKSFLRKNIMSNQNNAIAGVPADADPNVRLETALEILFKADPMLIDDLSSLANLSINDPDVFNLALKKLRALV